MTPTGRIAAVQALFFVSGFCGLVYESIWSQYLKLFLGHAAYAQSVVLVVFIGGMALGAWGAGRISHRLARPLVAYAAAELVVGGMALLFHPAFVASTDWAYDTLLPATCTVDSARPPIPRCHEAASRPATVSWCAPPPAASSTVQSDPSGASSPVRC